MQINNNLEMDQTKRKLDLKKTEGLSKDCTEACVWSWPKTERIGEVWRRPS